MTEQTQNAEQAQTQSNNNDMTDALMLATLLQRMKGGNIDADAVRKIVREELANVPAQKIEIHTDNYTATLENEIVCEDFAEIVQDVHDGHFVYLYGAAGCGKSHTAKQVADALGLDFYPMQQLLFAHDVQGYGDAHGNYIETPFYKAFTRGGLVFLDEWDSSSPEAALVVNGAIANGRFTFPVVGNKTAHKDFRIIAAGNTVGTGADMNYTGRNILDASTLDRMTFYEMHYDGRVELPIMARGNKELYDFIVALRKAIEKAGVNLIVSYRATAYMATRTDNKIKTLKRCTLKGMSADDIRMINAHTEITETNAWKKALSEIAQ